MPKLLTIIGRNFGIDLPLAYAGRRQEAAIGPYEWDPPNLLYDPAIIPDKVSSIKWWDMAQYRTCFSIAEKAEPPPEGTPADKVSLYRKCDAGVVLSEMINLQDMTRHFKGEATPRYLQRMIVKAPVVPLDSTQVSVRVNALVEVLGQRSIAEPELNCTLSFRQSCSDYAPNMGRFFLPMQMAIMRIGGLSTRAAFQVISWPTQDRLVWIGGSTQDVTYTRNIFLSGFSGVYTWEEMPYNDARPWFSPRSLQTVVIFSDMLLVMGGWAEVVVNSKSSTVYYNDVWVYCHVSRISKFYATEDNPEPPTPKGVSFAPYWRRISEHAPWPARKGMTAVEFRGALYIMGGDGPEGPIADLWSTKDLKTWDLLQVWMCMDMY